QCWIGLPDSFDPPALSEKADTYSFGAPRQACNTGYMALLFDLLVCLSSTLYPDDQLQQNFTLKERCVGCLPL
ncbi:hypothetical protein NL474_30590, partial [Klebsiella pneumoniae]|nr:hypothetical protein [Klebsiella pneumoniae]